MSGRKEPTAPAYRIDVVADWLLHESDGTGGLPFIGFLPLRAVQLSEI
jgi:hypothetical protein